MNYSKRIQIAAVFSILLHVASVGVWFAVPSPTPNRLEPQTPIVIDLQPDDLAPPEPVQLVDVATAAPDLVPPSRLIAEENSEAADESPDVGNENSPQLKLDDFDRLAARPSPPAMPEPPSNPSPERKATEEPPEEKHDIESTEAEIESSFEDLEDSLEELLAPDKESQEIAQADDAPIKIAQAMPTLPQQPSKGTSRSQDSVSRYGATNFQAIQSEIAPYLKHVRDKVEREWNEMLYTRYSGTSPVKAVIDCAISPSGKLVSVSVVGSRNDLLYGGLCKDAVQRAGPFGPFPFVVPDIYRDKNLEIRWTFSFL